MHKVEQCDREAAWPFRPNCYGPSDKAAWMNGFYDHILVIQAFAAHRIAAIEQCAGVALGEKYADYNVSAREREGDTSGTFYNEACDDIATAIRNLKGGA